MNDQLKFYVDQQGQYLGAMCGELLPGSPHPYPTGLEVESAPDSLSERWSFEEKQWEEIAINPD